MSDPEVVGRVGRVVTRVRGGTLPGEVAVPVRGTTETYLAWCDEPVERASAVLVIAERGPRQVDVVPWDAGTA